MNSTTTWNLWNSSLRIVWIGFALASATSTCLASSHDAAFPSTSGGIAAPSNTTAPFQNAAGLVLNSGTLLNTAVESDNDRFKDPVLQAGIFTGNGDFGGTAGVRRATSGDATSAFAGLGVLAKGLDTALGLSAESVISSGSSTSWNAGLLLGARQKMHLGFTARNFTSSSHEWGAGLAIESAQNLSFIVDSTLDHDFKNPWIAPGILIRGSTAALTLCYGISLGDKEMGSSAIAEGFGAGMALALGSKAELQAYYRQLNRFVVELNFKLN